MHFVQLEFGAKSPHPWLFKRLNDCCADARATIRMRMVHVKLLNVFIVRFFNKGFLGIVDCVPKGRIRYERKELGYFENQSLCHCDLTPLVWTIAAGFTGC